MEILTILCIFYATVALALVGYDWYSVRLAIRQGDSACETHTYFFIFCLAIISGNGIMLVDELYDCAFYLSTVVIVIEVVCIRNNKKEQ